MIYLSDKVNEIYVFEFVVNVANYFPFFFLEFCLMNRKLKFILISEIPTKILKSNFVWFKFKKLDCQFQGSFHEKLRLVFRNCPVTKYSLIGL